MRSRPSAAAVIGLLALFVALGGPALAARALHLTGREFKDRSLQTRDFSARAVRQLRTTPRRGAGQYALRSGSVTRRALARGSVGGLQIADGQVTGADFRRRSIGHEQVPPDSITHIELGRNAVGQAELLPESIDKDAIKGRSVGSAQTIDGSLRLEDLRTTAGTVTVTFGALAPRRCATEVGSLAERPRAPLIVGIQATFPDGVTLTGRRGSGARVRLTACNHTETVVTPGAQAVPLLAFR